MKKECKGIIHKIEKGDTLYKISRKYGVRLSDIMKENPYVNVYNLQIGEEICVPVEKNEEELQIYIKHWYRTILVWLFLTVFAMKFVLSFTPKWSIIGHNWAYIRLMGFFSFYKTDYDA